MALGAVVRLAWLAYARPEPVSDFRHYLYAGYALLDTGVFGIGHPTAWRLLVYPAVLAAGAVVTRHPPALAPLTAGIEATRQCGACSSTRRCWPLVRWSPGIRWRSPR